MNFIKKLTHFMPVLAIAVLAFLFLFAANVSAESNEEELLKAAFSGDAKIVKELIDKGANINFQNEKKFNALMVAAQYGHSDIVTMLLEKNADVNLKNAGDTTALMLATKNGHVELLKPY